MADAGKMTIAIGSDHRGIKMKERIVARLLTKRHKIKDFGAFNDEPADYPVYALKVGQFVSRKKASFGILLCHTGNGMAIAANKVPGVRAAICPDRIYAALARQHNDANILVIPAGFVRVSAVQPIIDVFLKTRFDGGRHRRRVNQIRRYEKNNVR